MGKIYLIRHAQSEGNLYRRALGWYDGPISLLGQRQIAALAERFRDIPVDAVYSSDLLRAQDTARAITSSKGLEVSLEPAFREIHLGEFTNIPYGDFRYHHPRLYEAFFSYSPQWAPREGESFQQVAHRVTPAFFRLAEQHRGERIAIVSHAMTIRCLQSALRGKRPDQVSDLPPSANTAVSCYEVQGDRFRIIFENDVSHLPAELHSTIRPNVPLVRFRSISWEREEEFYRTARRDAWLAVHPDLLSFDGPGYLQEAREQSLWDPRAVQVALDGEELVGLLQLSTLTGAQAGVGRVPLLWVREEYRRQGVGIQLLGQAVSTYRGMGRSSLRLQCSPENLPAQAFYTKYGFSKVGQVPGLQGSLDLLALPI